MELYPFTPNYLPAAVELFRHNFRLLRESLPPLPATLDNETLISGNLSRLLKAHPGVVALEEGRLVGYLTYMLVNDFRDGGKRAAYSPEWGHAVAAPHQAQAYRRMYRQIAAQWAAQGCQVHAITLLANDPDALQTWFWNGFGMLVVDAVRPMAPLEREPKTRLHIRQAGAADEQALAALEVEHRHYYSQSPVFMAERACQTADEFGDFMAQAGNSVWLALDGDLPVGFLRLNGTDFEASDALASPESVHITGAFLLPAYRGQGASSVMLQAAIQHHARLGQTRCSVDFETFNPDAAAFWMRYFQPVCLSLMRCPETVPPTRGEAGG